MTTDSLFNLPAFLTSQYWSKQNKAFLYSFEHISQNSAADDFLQENPLTEQGETPAEGNTLTHLTSFFTLIFLSNKNIILWRKAKTNLKNSYFIGCMYLFD